MTGSGTDDAAATGPGGAVAGSGGAAAAVPGGSARAPSGGGPDAVLGAALVRLRDELAGLGLPLATPGVDAARDDRAAALDQLDEYLLPRLAAPEAPLLVVVGGSTGAGKSTLVNSLLGEQVSVPGVLRPTTRAPVLVHHRADAAWSPAGAASEPPPGAAPVGAAGRDLRVVASAAVPPGLALLDAPDVDSVEDANRELAGRLLAAADLWLFVTTAARYADAVPWALLRGAAARRAQVALVVDRVDPGAEAVVADLRRMMDENDLADAPLFVVPETTLVEGLLPEDAVAELAAWLSGLGASSAARRAVALATRDGVVDDLVRRAVALAGAADEQVVADGRLRTVVARRYAEAATRVGEATSDGAMLRGEVLARWQELVGTGELFRSVEQGVGRLRDRITAALRGRPASAPRVEQAIGSGLEAVLVDAADEAAERTSAVWRSDPAGAPLVAGTDLGRSSAWLRRDAADEVRAWQGDVLGLVREQGASRRGTARALSFGVNALGVAAMVAVFASTGGLTGAEVGIAGGTALVAQKLLEAVFGDDAVRRLTATARERLDGRVRALLDAEAARFTGALDALGASAGGSGLRTAAQEVARAARAERATRPAGRPGRGDEPGARGAAGRVGARGGAGVPGRVGVPGDAGDTDDERVTLRGAGRWRPEPSDGPAAPGDTRRGLWRRLLRRGGAR